MKRKLTRQQIGKICLYIQTRLWYVIMILVLALTSGFMFIYELYATDLNELTLELLKNLDLSIAYIFLADFIVSMYFSRRGLKYVTENFLDFLGSIPFSDGLFQAMRILRFTRLVRILRGANTGLNIHEGIHKFREEEKIKLRKKKR